MVGASDHSPPRRISWPAVVVAAVLLVLAVTWLVVRAQVAGDGAPVLADPGFRHGLTANPLASNPSLRAGDVVVGVDGISVDGWLRRLGRPDSTKQMSYLVDRRGGLATVPVRLRHQEVTSARLRDGGGVLFCAVAILALGGYAVYRRREEPPARALLVLGAGLVAYATVTIFGYETADLVTHPAVFALGFIAASATLVVWLSAACHLALTFPQPPKLLAARLHWLRVGYVVVVVATVGVEVAVLASGAATLGRIDTINSVNGAVLTVLGVLILIGLAHTLWRVWRDPTQRAQGALVAIGFGATALGLFVANLVAGGEKWPGWLVTALFLPLPGAITVAILRGEFLGIRAVVNRTLVYAVLTVILLGLYVALVSGVGVLVGRTGVLSTVVSTAAVAIAFAPLRAAVQRSVDRLLYGDRRDPARVLSELGQRLEVVAAPDDVLAVIAETLATALNLPYVALRTSTGSEMRLACERGEPIADIHAVSLVHQGSSVGELLVGARRGERSLSSADIDLLASVARQVAPAVRAASLVTDLAASHGRLAVAHEEERARLRHDLHDRLGPHLVGVSLQLDSLKRRMDSPDHVALIDQAHGEAARAVDEVRRISRGLRPAELEDLGLVQAIGAAASRLSIADGEGDWHASVEAAVQLGALPSEVEAATYQIALEALTNAYRHSGGDNAWVRVGLDIAGRELIVEITDDGPGISVEASLGIGIRSMHARAEAVGGTVTIATRPAGGTVVRARLPL